MSFFKREENALIEAPNFVFNADYTLLAEDKDELIAMDVLPIDGWYWFDTIEEAISILGDPTLEENP